MDKNPRYLPAKIGDGFRISVKLFIITYMSLALNTMQVNEW